jgi:hypothetical protein
MYSARKTNQAVNIQYAETIHITPKNPAVGPTA